MNAQYDLATTVSAYNFLLDVPYSRHSEFVGGAEGHLSKECTQEAKPKSCYKCGAEGHLVRRVCLFHLAMLADTGHSPATAQSRLPRPTVPPAARSATVVAR